MKSDEIRRILPPPLEFRNLIDYPPSRILPTTHESKSRKNLESYPPRICKLQRLPPPPSNFTNHPRKWEPKISNPTPPSNIKIASTTPPSKNRGPTVAPPTKNSWLRACLQLGHNWLQMVVIGPFLTTGSQLVANGCYWSISYNWVTTGCKWLLLVHFLQLGHNWLQMVVIGSFLTTGSQLVANGCYWSISYNWVTTGCKQLVCYWSEIISDTWMVAVNPIDQNQEVHTVHTLSWLCC